MHPKKEKVYPAYVPKHNSNREKHVILLIISNGKNPQSKSNGQLFHLSCSKKTISNIKRNKA